MYRSPSGRYEVRTQSYEMRMSLWVHRPVPVDAESGEVLAHVDGLWSLDGVDWEGDDQAVLSLRRYPGDRSALVSVDFPRRTVRAPGHVPQPLRMLHAVLDGPPGPGALGSVLQNTLNAVSKKGRASAQGEPVRVEVERAIAAHQQGLTVGSALVDLYSPGGALERLAVQQGWARRAGRLRDQFDRATLDVPRDV